MRIIEKMSLNKICILFTIFFVAIIVNCHPVMADTQEKIAYFDNSNFSKNIISESIELKRTGSMRLDFGDDSYGWFSIKVTDSNGKEVFNQDWNFDFEDGKKYTISGLSAGTYVLSVTREDELCDCYLTVYGIYAPDEQNPEFSISDSFLFLYKGESDSLKVEAVPNTSTYEVKWKSKNPKIASVNGNGIVKAKSVGTTKITANVYCQGSLVDSFVCEVDVDSGWLYSDYSKAMKTYAKKHKGFQYKDIDKGKFCRLYSTGSLSFADLKIKTQGYGSIGTYEFYIELKEKSSGLLSLRLYCGNEFTMYDIFDEVDLDVNKLKLKSSNRMMNFENTIVSQDNHYSLKGYYYGKTKARALISDASKLDTASVKKFKTMLGQKSTSFKIACENGAYFSGQLASQSKNTTIKLVDEYLKLAKNM